MLDEGRPASNRSAFDRTIPYKRKMRSRGKRAARPRGSHLATLKIRLDESAGSSYLVSPGAAARRPVSCSRDGTGLVSYRSVAMRGLGERVATGDNAAIPMVGPWETAPRAPRRRPACCYGTRSPLQEMTRIIDFTFRFPMLH